MMRHINKLRKLTYVFVISFIFAGMSTQMASAYDQFFYQTNDIVYYDPEACEIVDGATGTVNLQGSDVAEKVFRFLTTTPFEGFDGKPFNAIQAAGALGNFQQESGMDPAAVEGNGEGHGLAQWSFGRKSDLFNLAHGMSKGWDTLEVQIEMMKNELNGGYGRALVKQDVDGLKFQSVTTPKDASYVFQKVYEAAGAPNQANRDKWAQAYYDKFKDLAPGSASTDGSSNCASNTKDSDFASDGFVIYNQFDPQWAKHPYGGGTISGDGCGPSAMAMAITALTGKQVTPVETSDYAASKGMYTPNGSSWAIAKVLAEHYGLQAKNISNTTSAVNAVLSSGGLVVTSGSGPSPFTSGGHYILIRGVTSDGKWKIGDSNGNAGKANSNKEWDPAHILQYANAGNVVAITK